VKLGSPPIALAAISGAAGADSTRTGGRSLPA
jgi:hypothetical protein